METMFPKKRKKSVSEFYCNLCDCKFMRKYDYERHLSTRKHFGNNVSNFGNKKAYFTQKKAQDDTLGIPMIKNSENVDNPSEEKAYFTQKKVQDDTLGIPMIENSENVDNPSEENAYFTQKKEEDDTLSIPMIKNSENVENLCEGCGKKYENRTGLWKHKKKCIVVLKEAEPKLDLADVKEIFSAMMKTNVDFQNLMLESNQVIVDTHKMMLENVKTNGTTVNNTYHNNNNTNIQNNKFSLNFFLNETCKDAMNIMDFVNLVKSQLKLKDFDAYEEGYSNTISGVFIRGLEGLDVCKRPIHCSDFKREVIYVKDDDTWQLDTNQQIVTKAVKYISHYNFKQYPSWEKEHPECKDTTSKTHEHYMKLVRNCMAGGTDDEINANYKKIIRNVIKEVVIDKKKNKEVE